MMQKNGLLRKSVVLLFCFFVLAVTACDKLPFGYTKIGDIVNNPAAFDGKEIQIRETGAREILPFLHFAISCMEKKESELKQRGIKEERS